MQLRLKHFQSLCRFGTRIYLNSLKGDVRCVNDGNYFMWNSFCTITELPQVDESLQKAESPELPDWIKSFEKSSDDDDFVPPSVSHWIENEKFHVKKANIESTVSESADSDVHKISKILMYQFGSPDAVVEALNGLRDVDVTESLMEQILKRFSFDWIQTVGSFKWAKSQTGFKGSRDLYDLVVDNLGKARKFDLMWEFVEEMKLLEGYITFTTMIRVMRRLVKAGKFDDAVEVFRNLEQYRVHKDVNAMNVVIDALVKDRTVEHAKKVYLEFKHEIPPNKYTFNILVHGWCKAKKMEEAKKTLDEMRKHGFDPDVITYTSFLEAYCSEKDFRKVDTTLDEMHRKGINPTAVTYTIIMNAFGKAKETNRVLDIYEKMKQNNSVPDTVFYSSLILNLSKFGRLKDAREVFEDMPRQGVDPDVVAYNAMITAFVSHSKEEDAVMLLRKMEESQCMPNLKTYAPLLRLCCGLRRMKVLSFLLNHMFKNNVCLDLGTYSLLVTRLCVNGSLDRACSIFEEAVRRGFVPTHSMCEKLVKELQIKEMYEEKEWIAELMRQAKQRAYVDSPKEVI